ncbi:queuosine precursor transporter [Lentibacillus halophilus]|uniref:Probable queuosine precursor transporter n=1 Tax=Lentibacillus halophilus TaxID=295065 RepID=A0ABN0ZAM1_9BACI
MFVYLNALFIGLFLLSNVLGVKLFSIGSVVLPGTLVVYVVTYIITDVISEVYGKDAARKTVLAGFLTQVVALVFIFIVIQLPAAPDFGLQTEFAAVLGGSFRVMVASLMSYAVSQNLDVSIFHYLKARHGDSKLWIRNNVSTMTSQLADTAIFITVAFWGTVPFSVLMGMLVSQYVVKLLIALLDTPVVYMLVTWAQKSRMNVNIPGA